MTRFTENGKITNVEYDNYGNITKTDEGIITYNSRNLMDSYEKLNSDKYNYYYNYQGIRFKKQKINGNTINYILDGSRILGEDEVNPNGDIVRKFRYFYDAIGVCGIDYIVNNEHHYFNLIKDSLGNISKVMNHGKYVGEYTYDAWGNCEVSTSFSNDDNDIYVVNHNPFRYKGYYYDEETGLFYCNSRYYNPKWGRWLSPDSIIYLNPRSINGLNLYAYCFNDPINYFDNLGKYPQSNNYNSIWKWRNKDGSWSLYDNDRFEDETPFHEQFFVLNGQLINYNLKDNVHGIGITSFDLITGGWEWDYLDLSLLDFGHAELGLEISKTEGLKVSAMASIYSPSISFKLFGLTFEISFEIGAIGAEAELFSKEGFKLKAAGGLGLGLSIDW